jgi:hypothetical protein
MSKAKEPPVRIECAGGCGKFQMVRRSRVDDRYTYIGCGKCEGWNKLRDSLFPIPEGMCLEHDFGVAGGFTGLRLRIATQDERASIGRARVLRDAAIAMLRR